MTFPVAAAETEPFVLEEKLLNFTQREVLSVPVKVADTSVSGVNRNYTLCLSVMPSEGEIRALVAHDSMCTNVTIVNNNSKSYRLHLSLPTSPSSLPWQRQLCLWFRSTRCSRAMSSSSASRLAFGSVTFTSLSVSTVSEREFSMIIVGVLESFGG